MPICFVADFRNTTRSAQTHIHPLSAAAGGSPGLISCPFLDGGTGTAKERKNPDSAHLITYSLSNVGHTHTLSA